MTEATGRSGLQPPTEPAAATTADTQAALLDRLEELAAKQDEIRAMLIEPQRPPTNG